MPRMIRSPRMLLFSRLGSSVYSRSSSSTFSSGYCAAGSKARETREERTASGMPQATIVPEGKTNKSPVLHVVSSPSEGEVCTGRATCTTCGYNAVP